VQAADGPVLILAGAGSGKTRVITHRIAWLIDQKGVAPDSILAVTFTNKAAAEMSERVDRLIGGMSLARPHLSTFHSFCVRVLRRDVEALRTNGVGLTRDFAIYDENDQQQLVKQCMRRLGIDDKQHKPSAVLSRISWAKNHMMDPQEYFLASANPQDEKVAHVFEAYRKELARANALDFDDLLLETVRLLRAAPDVRERYNRRYRYILIDEYQDTNRPQYELMKLLAGTHHNICVVGDEDQSIYSWRGADIRNILEFERDFPEVRTIRLEQNYRSTQSILAAASAVVRNNTQRKGKELWTARDGGSLIGLYEAPDGENEALFVADQISSYLGAASADPAEPARCAVLYRTNAQSRLIEEALRRYVIPYTMVGGFSFYERAEVKDVLAYLKLIANPDDSIALQRCINTPPRGIGKTTLEVIERLALETGSSTWLAARRAVTEHLLSQRATTALDGFLRLIADARAMLAPGFADKLSADAAAPASSQSPAEPVSDERENDISFNFGTDFDPAAEIAAAESDTAADSATAEPAPVESSDGFRTPGSAATLPELIKFILDRSGMIRVLESEGTPEAFSRIENLKELANAAQDAHARGESLAAFLDHAALASDTDAFNAEARVTLMSLHGAKGLEFPLVFLTGMEEGLFPHSRTFNDPTQLEEERRLCYVGMTRAMDTLILTRARYRRRYGNDMPESSMPSRFLAEIPATLVQDLGSPPARDTYSDSGYGSRFGNRYGGNRRGTYGAGDSAERHYNYEDEDQSAPRTAPPSRSSSPKRPGSLDNIASFFGARGAAAIKNARLSPQSSPAADSSALRRGARVRHAKYGDGTVLRREGDGDDAKLTVEFTHHGVKKLVERFARLERL
jgi:DNA helicase-2/ATP-dependent DNA helicase PcrA